MSSIDFQRELAWMESSEHLQAAEAAAQEAARVMSPRGLANYFEGMRAISATGKGMDLVLAFAQEMPGVVKEVGEDVLIDVLQALMKLSSLTSGAILALAVANLPLAAQRLGDGDLLRGYLGLLHQLAAKTPRGVRPMLENLDELLAKLTLGGLKRWAMWGTQAHARDFDGQVAYFGLKSESSRAVLQQERSGTLFVDIQRKLNFYLRALWGRAFFLRPAPADIHPRPFIEDWFVHLPDAYEDVPGLKGVDVYRAAAAHAAAHVVYTSAALSAEQLTPVHMKCIDIFEDARVEHLAVADFPGLAKLWAPFFAAAAEHQAEHPALTAMDHLAHALLTGETAGLAADLAEIATDYRAALAGGRTDNTLSWDYGMRLFHALAAGPGLPALRLFERHATLGYRDDNRYVWDFDEAAWSERGFDVVPGRERQVRKHVGLMEFVNEIDVETAGDDADEIWVLGTELFPYEDEGVSYNQREGKEAVSDPFHYQEWDYQVQLYRPDWATVTERGQPRADPKVMDDVLARYKPVATRIRHLIDALQPRGVVRKRGYEEGDEIDLEAAVRAMIDIRRGTMPDPRIGIRITRHIRDLSVLILLDLSNSTGDRVHKEDEDSPTILELTRDATGLLAWAIAEIGDPFAIHGFASDGRHDVRYHRFKDFADPYDEMPKSRLAGMQGALSTRMGTALRHAAWHLGQQPSARKLVLVITDGEPADIDERDPQYLRHDTKKAVEELATRGIHTYCLTLDPLADRYVARIFGENHYSVVDHVERLPERLPSVFAAITG
jgi:hypothetical protein